MNDRSGPLDAYVAKVLSDEDRLLFEEAARAASVEAPRAAFIMIWISCAESLKRKFRDISPRDGKAQKTLGEISARESAQKSVDKYLLDQAKEYGFLTDTEHHRLEHIYEMRCIYGHPYEAQPSAEDLIAAAAAVVDLVLSRPTKLREGYLAEQVRLLVEDRTFLDDVPEAAERHAMEVCSRSDERLHLWFLRKLWAKLTEMSADPLSTLFYRRGIWFSRDYLSRSNALGADSDWDVVADLTQYSDVLSEVLTDPNLFPLMGAHAQDIVVGNLLATGASNSAHLRYLESLHDAGVLNARQDDRFVSEMKKMPLEHLVSSGVSPVYYADLIVESLKQHNWYIQNPAISILRNIGTRGVARVLVQTQYLLGENVLQAADGGSSGAIGFMDGLARTDEKWPEAFIEGLISECFVNGKGEVRFKTTRAHEALMTLRLVADPARKAIIERLVGRVGAGKTRLEFLSSQTRKEMLGIIDSASKIDETIVDDLHRLAEAVAAVKVVETKPDDE